MNYIVPYFQIKNFPNSFGVNLQYRISPNQGCEIVDISSPIPGQGVGTLVYKEFELFLIQSDIKNVYAFTRYSNNKAHKWYLKMKFTSTCIPSFYFDEIEMKAWILTKFLAK